PPQYRLTCVVLFFFFQAEDGIRDRNVTGVQTCALPILNITPQISSGSFELGKAFTNEIANFVDAGLGRAESVAPVGHGLEIVKILEAIYASAQDGREVQLG